MSSEPPFDLDALIKVQVDRAVAPYLGKSPPFVLAKLRELAERHWRENPVAVDALRRKLQNAQLRSGTETIGAATDAENEGANRKQGS